MTIMTELLVDVFLPVLMLLLSLTCGWRRTLTSGVGAICMTWVVASLSSMQMPLSHEVLVLHRCSNHRRCPNHIRHRRRIIITFPHRCTTLIHPHPRSHSLHQRRSRSRPRTRQCGRFQPWRNPRPPRPLHPTSSQWSRRR